MKKTLSTHLESPEIDHVKASAKDRQVSDSAYVRHLVREDMRRADTDALTALSLDELARIQQVQAQQLEKLTGYLPAMLQAMSDELNALTVQQAITAERELHLHQRSWDAYRSMADTVVVALDHCQTILDADNSILESIERRLRSGGR